MKNTSNKDIDLGKILTKLVLNEKTKTKQTWQNHQLLHKYKHRIDRSLVKTKSFVFKNNNTNKYTYNN